MEKVKLKINQEKFIKSFKNAFTSTEKLITELAQNSRRSGAQNISIQIEEGEDGKQLIIIEDDGHGISDMQDLLNLGVSGWDKETGEEEKPFGVGFLQAIYQSEDITVSSRGKMFSAKREDILEGKEIVICDTDIQKTQIVLVGTKAVLPFKIQDSLEGFPVNYDLYLSGEKLENDRKFCRNSLMKNDKYSYFSTEIGDIFIDFSALYDKYRFLSKRIYYQGLQISNRYNSENVIIHAANDIGEVRMPDRDCFVNESEVMTLIGNKINEFAVSYLKGLCQRDLLKIPLNALKRYLGEAFMQDLDHIPSSWLYRFSGSNPENEKNRGHVTSRFSESHFDFCRENLGDTLVVEIDSGKYFDLPCNTNHGYRYWPIAFLFEMSDEHYVLVEEGDFPEGHWILENSIKIEDIHPTIRIQEKEHKSVEIEDETTEFLFCKSFRITSELNGRSLDTGDITEGYCLAPDPEDGEDIVIFANACTDDDAIIDSRSLVDENGYNQTLESIVRDEFQTLLKRRRFSNYPEKLIESELSSLAKYIEKGSTFILTFDEEVRAEKQ